MIDPTANMGDRQLYLPPRYPPSKTPIVAVTQGGAVKSCVVDVSNPKPKEVVD